MLRFKTIVMKVDLLTNFYYKTPVELKKMLKSAFEQL